MDQHHRQLRAAQGLHQRRLSSTPIKSPPSCALQRCSSDNSSGTSDAFVLKTRDGQDGGREDEQEDSEVSSCEFEEQEVTVKPPVFPAASDPPYDKRSYQDEDSCRDSDVSAEESTLMEDEDGRQRKVVFDDDVTWNDLEETAFSDTQPRVSPVSKATANGVSPPERALVRKVAVSRAVETDRGAVAASANQEPDAPPASQLMTKLFPSLKPKTQNAPLPPPPVAPESKRPESETGETETNRKC